MIIGYAYVVADVLHVGHIQHLKNCKALCDKLIVGVLTDEAAMEKKPRPLLSFNERVAVISEMRSVDAVVPQHEYSPVINVEEIKPDVLFECQQHKERTARGVRVMSMPYYPGISSTNIRERFKDGN